MKQFIKYILFFSKSVFLKDKCLKLPILANLWPITYGEVYKNNDWDEEECRDDKEFLKIEEEMWAKMYPGQASASAEKDKVGDEVTTESANEGDSLCQFFDDCDNADVGNLPLPLNELGLVI